MSNLIADIAHNPLVGVEETLIILLVVAAAAAMLSRAVKLPYTVILVVVGLVIGLLRMVHHVHLSADVAFYVVLPVILFEGALNTPARHLRRDWPLIALLAGPGIIVAFALTALGVHWLGLAWAGAALFGALISATDPVSVVALFRGLNASERLTTIVESESMFNDGTAAVLFTIALATLPSAAGVSLGHAALQFLWMLAGGLAVGVGVGYVAYRLHSRYDEAMLELLFTTIVAYGSFLAAQALHMSGPVACATAGIVIGNVGRSRGMSEEVSGAVGVFWEYAAFLANSVVFVLIGLRIDLGGILGNAGLVIAAFSIVIVARAVTVYSLGGVMSLTARRVPLAWLHVLTWGGVRGTVALALVLSLPSDTPQRATIEVLAFGVVLLSLLVQGLTIRPLVAWLRLTGSTETGDD